MARGKWKTMDGNDVPGITRLPNHRKLTGGIVRGIIVPLRGGLLGSTFGARTADDSWGKHHQFLTVICENTRERSVTEN